VLSEEVQSLGILPQGAHGVWPQRTSSASIVAHRASSDRDAPDRAAAEGKRAESEASHGQDDADGKAAEGEGADGEPAEGHHAAGETAKRHYSGGHVADGNDPSCVTAKLTTVGVGARGDGDHRDVPEGKRRPVADAARAEAADPRQLLLELVDPTFEISVIRHVHSPASSRPQANALDNCTAGA